MYFLCSLSWMDVDPDLNSSCQLTVCPTQLFKHRQPWTDNNSEYQRERHQITSSGLRIVARSLSSNQVDWCSNIITRWFTMSPLWNFI